MTLTYAQTRNEIKRLSTEAQRKADGIKLNAKHNVLRSYLERLLNTDTAPSFPVVANAELEQLREQLEAARHEIQQQTALAAKLADELEVSRNSEQRLMAQVTALSVDTDTLTQELEETREALAHTQASLKSANEVINTMKASKDAKRTAANKPEPKQSKPASAPELHDLTRLIIDKELSRGDAQVKAADAVSTYMYLNDTRTDALYDYLLHDIYAEPAVQTLIDKAVRTAVALPPLDAQ